MYNRRRSGLTHFLSSRFRAAWGVFSQAYNDYNTLFISASADNSSQAVDRFAEGKTAAFNLVKQLDNGSVTLGEKETIKIIGHSQGAAFAAGMASVLAKHQKYSSRLEVVHYISSHQPNDFEHPANIQGHQWSTVEDQVSSSPSNLLSVFNGKSSLGQIKGISFDNYNLHLRYGHNGGRGGHSVDTWVDDVVKYFRDLGVTVNVY